MNGSTLMLAFPLRKYEKPVRDPAYLSWIRTMPSVVSKKRWGIEAAHTGPHGVSQKSSDFTALPLTRAEHRELHRIGPRRFQALHCVDFESLTIQFQALWMERTRGKAA